jgi:hypothetical protein
MICFLIPVGKYIFDNLYWIIPTAATLLMIYFVKRTSKEQIESSRIALLEQINIEKIENHRPCITVTKFEGTIESPDFIMDNKSLLGMGGGTNKLIVLKNIGYGIANNVKLFSLIDNVELEPIDGEIFISISVEDSYYLKIRIKDNVNEKDIPFKIFYNDLYGNKYSSEVTLKTSSGTYSCKYNVENNKPPTGDDR